LAGHFFKSEDYEKGSEYSQLAAKKAQKSALFEEAIEHAKMRILCLEKLPKSEKSQRQLIDARTVISGYHLNLSYLVQANEAVAPIVDLALELNYRRRLPGIYLALGVYNYWVEEDYVKGLRYLEKALEVSEEVKDLISLYLTNLHLGWTLSWECEFAKVLEHLDKCLDLSLLANNPVGIAHAKGVMSVSNHNFSGKIDLAFCTSEESLKIAKESGDIFIKGMAYASHGVSCYFKGLLDEAEHNLLKGLAYSEKNAQVAWVFVTSFWLGERYVEMGEVDKACHYYNFGISVLERARILPYFVRLAKVCVARAESSLHDRNINLSVLFDIYKAKTPRVFEGWITRYIGEILLNIDDAHMSAAEDWIRKAIEANKKNGTIWFLANDYALYASLLQRKGDISEAKENLAKAVEIFKKCGADGWVKKYEEELASLS